MTTGLPMAAIFKRLSTRCSPSRRRQARFAQAILTEAAHWMPVMCCCLSQRWLEIRRAEAESKQLGLEAAGIEKLAPPMRFLRILAINRGSDRGCGEFDQTTQDPS